MSVIGSNILAGASGQAGYNLTKSLRFRSSASAYLNRTPASAGNRQKFTISVWYKAGKIGVDPVNANIINAGGDGSSLLISGTGAFGATYNDRLLFREAGTTLFYWDRVFRDPSAWYHILFAMDTTQATAANRAKLYVNGVDQGAFSGTAITQNTSTSINNNTAHYINLFNSAYYHSDLYYAEYNLIDGQQLTPSSFGETSTSTGVWIPKKYTGTYGTNGFYLPFTDTTSTSTLGTDFSGNSNTWTVNNISLTSGSTYDSMTDVPTLTSITQANYCVLSPIDRYDNSPTDGNLKRVGVGHTGSPFSTCRGTIGVSSGKWYFEALNTGTVGSSGNNMIGVMTTTSSDLTAFGGSTNRSYQDNGGLQGDNSTGTVSSSGNGDIIMIAFDVDAGKMWVGKNGTWMNSGAPASGTGNVFTTLPTSPVAPQISMYGNVGDTKGWILNFGQQPFSYTPPTGFVALNTFNLPTPTIGATASSQANKYMNIALYTGTGSSQSITGLGFQPDWTWIKGRSGATDHGLYDSVRGVQKQLESNNTSAETTETTGLTAFGSDGFTVGALAQLNTSSATYVGWNWKANGAGSTNTAGSITSTVSANTTAGFSIVTWTGSGSTATIGHGLGVAPSMIIWFHRTNAGAYSHGVYHVSLPSAAYAVQLNLTNGQSNDNNWWNSTAPTSSVFTVGGYNVSDTMVAYCFAPVAGYSAFGSYTGNGSTDGTFVYTGFRPAFLLIKRTDSAGGWYTYDDVRSTYNLNATILQPNLSDAEFTGTNNSYDFLSNGFKNRGTGGDNNASGGTYIYMAFAEVPQKFALGR